MIVQAAPPEHYPWLISRTKLAVTTGFRAIEAIDSRGQIAGMVGYDNWAPNSCEAHMAVDSPMAWRSMLRPAFEYPFEQCGRGVLLAVIPAWNTKSIRLTKHFGFTESHRIINGWEKGVDIVVWSMLREQCRWIGRERMAA